MSTKRKLLRAIDDHDGCRYCQRYGFNFGNRDWLMQNTEPPGDEFTLEDACRLPCPAVRLYVFEHVMWAYIDHLDEY